MIGPVMSYVMYVLRVIESSRRHMMDLERYLIISGGIWWVSSGRDVGMYHRNWLHQHLWIVH